MSRAAVPCSRFTPPHFNRSWWFTRRHDRSKFARYTRPNLRRSGKGCRYVPLHLGFHVFLPWSQRVVDNGGRLLFLPSLESVPLELALVLTLATIFGAGAVVCQPGDFDGTFAPGFDYYFLVSRIAKIRLQWNLDCSSISKRVFNNLPAVRHASRHFRSLQHVYLAHGASYCHPVGKESGLPPCHSQRVRRVQSSGALSRPRAENRCSRPGVILHNIAIVHGGHRANQQVCARQNFKG